MCMFLLYPDKTTCTQNVQQCFTKRNTCTNNTYVGSTEKKHAHRNIELNNNFITNTNTKEKNYLTQAENLILYKLFSERVVNKKLLERDVLEIKQDLNTSSIESHLNRIRKKLKKINSDFSVTSKNNNVFLEIVNPDKQAQKKKNSL